MLQQLVVPTLRWLLNAQSQAPSGSDGVDAKGSGEPVSSMLQTLLVGLCYVRALISSKSCSGNSLMFSSVAPEILQVFF
jgi:hypothetical protein